MTTDDDMWDPTGWGPTIHEYRIYGDPNLRTWVVVDEIDYAWASRWKWTITTRGYMKRSTYVGSRTDGSRRSISLYLHIEILKRAKKKQPTPKHNIGDHIDIDPTNCRRKNLRWVTKGMNNANSKRYKK